MSLAETCAWTLARTVTLCLLAWPVALGLERSLRSASDAFRPWLLAGVLAPFCFPELLVGFAFRDFALAHPEWAEALCNGLLFVRIVPVGACALLAAPHRKLNSAAIHCRWLLLRRMGTPARPTCRNRIDPATTGDREQSTEPRWTGRSAHPTHHWYELARCYWHGPIARALPALALMSLIAFQEFETAALLQTMSWTDWFVAAQRVGLDRTEMLSKSLWPMLLQLPVLFGVMRWLSRTPDGDRDDTSFDYADSHSPRHRTMTRLMIVYIAGAGIAGCLIPLGLIGWRAVDGFGLLLRQHTQQLGLIREIGTAGSVALCAGIAAWTLSGRSSRSPLRGLLLPGLFGSLLLSLCLVATFQQSWLRPLYDTPLPWVIALTLWLLPRAAILRVWLQAARPSEAVHLAEMAVRAMSNEQRAMREMRGSRALIAQYSVLSTQYSSLIAHRSSLIALLWRLRDEPRFLAVSLLCFWAYCDLPTAYLLAPSGMASGLVRLYNFMHYGRSAALSVEAILFFGTPILIAINALVMTRYWRH